MSAYVVFIRHHTHNPAELEQYAPLARAARPGHEITPLAFYGEIEVLEGNDLEGTVILQFPDMQAARAWYHSPAYQKAKAHRNLGADYTVFLTNGVPATGS